MDNAISQAAETPRNPFSYVKLPEGHIRILTLQSDGHRLRGSLQNFPLDNPPYYIALSWSWPPKDAPQQEILCNQRPFRVATHLYTGLWNLCPQDTSCSLRIWIDTVCIDQDNDIEKAEQVKCMGKIYSRARRVVAWLGEHPDGINVGEYDGMIRLVLKILKSARKDYAGLPRYTNPVWRVLLSLFRSRWNHRLWVVQEVVHAHAIDFLYLDYLIPWRTVQILRQLPWYANDASSQRTAPEVEQGKLSINALWFMGEEFRKDGYLNFLHLSGSLLRFKMVTESVDRVYAVHSLLDAESQNSIKIDYSETNKKHPWSLYRQLGEMSLRICGAHTLQYANSEKRPNELPSWCPNWDSPYTVQPMLCGREFRAGGAFSEIEEQKKPKISLNSLHVNVYGFQIDRVAHIHELGVNLQRSDLNLRNVDSETAAEWLNQEQACFKLASDAIGDKAAAQRAHLRNMTGNSTKEGRLITESDWPRVLKAYEAFLQFLNDCRSNTVQKSYDWSKEIQPIISRLQDKSVIRLFARPYFVTSRQRLGRGVPGMKVGDEICIIYSAQAPIILRRNHSCHDHHPANLNTLVGDAYLDDCMNLDTMPSIGRGPDREFTIA